MDKSDKLAMLDSMAKRHGLKVGKGVLELPCGDTVKVDRQCETSIDDALSAVVSSMSALGWFLS